MTGNDHSKFMRRAVELAETAYRTKKGLPIGCVIVRDGAILGKGHNEIFFRNNPTSHAEMVAIEDACRNTGELLLPDCQLYTTLEPCPMCMAALYWTKVRTVYFSIAGEEGARFGFNDVFIRNDLAKPAQSRLIKSERVEDGEALKALEAWEAGRFA